ncbi:MAG: hypothetical protein P1R58_01765 [bacterium]|nr:hypothetical protein [bacterium]
MLIFWGHVENYAPLIAFTIVFLLCGVLVSRSVISIWWAVSSFCMAVLAHGLAIVFLPSLLYLLVRNSRLVKRWKSQGLSNQLLYLILGFIVSCIGYTLALKYWSSFRVFFLPLLPRLGDYQSSAILDWNHLYDLANLLLLLFPGLLVISFAQIAPLKRGRGADSAFGFVLAASACGLIALATVDARLGEWRDWDMLSVMVLPTVFLLFHVGISNRSRMSFVAVVLTIGLGFIDIGSRIMIKNDSRQAVAHFGDYIKREPHKSLNARQVLIDYYYAHGDSSSAKEHRLLRLRECPEYELNLIAQKHVDEGRFRLSLEAARQAWRINPEYSDACFNIGGSFFSLGQFDSALYYLEIADGMNPFNAQFAAILGVSHFRLGNSGKAEEYLKRSVSMDSTQTDALAVLTELYIARGKLAEASSMAVRLTELPNISPSVLMRIGIRFEEKEAHRQAAAVVKRAVDVGMDSTYVDSLVARYPNLAPFL